MTQNTQHTVPPSLNPSTSSSSMRKDLSSGGLFSSVMSPPLSFPKPFAAALLILSLLLAAWQLHPYHSLFSFSSCPSVTANLKLASSPSSSSASSFTYSTVLDPNKRTFVPFGNAAALFVLMGAYRGAPNSFAIVGLASKPAHVYSKPWFKCEWVPLSPNSSSVRTKAYKMLPDWGYGHVYTVVIVNCTFPSVPNSDSSGGKLFVNAYYSTSSRRYERFLALEEAPGAYKESRFHPPYKYDYLYCGSSLYGDLSPKRMREWIAYHAYFFGPNSHFVFHDAGGISPDVRKALDPWVKAGRATVQDIRDQSAYDGYYYNQFLIVNDCLHRYRHAANWTFYFDVDEYIYVPNGNTLESVLEEFKDYTQFTIEQNPMSSKLCVDDPKRNYPSEWGFEKLVFRNAITGVRRDRKYAIQARNAYATGVHMSENVMGKTLHKTEEKIRYYHYHNTINVLGEPCSEFVPIPPDGNATWFEKVPYVFDDNMKRIADKIKRFEVEAIGRV